MNKKLKIHFVGIKGVGQAALAIIAKEAGFVVTGSDINEEFITDPPLKKAGIVPFIGFSKEHITNQDLVITTGAHEGFDNVEVREARRKGIKVITKGEAVGVFMDGGIFGRKFEGISVAGSHGKTTVTAMIATILKENNLDPSFIAGTGLIPTLGSPGHFGKGKYFVAEADEYATEPRYNSMPQFLWQHPKIAVFTNIELDHPDLYKNVSQVREAFLKFAKSLPEEGVLICCGDDEQIKLLLQTHKGRVTTYGFSSSCDFTLERVSISGTQTFFWARSKGISLGQFSLGISGEHNALNALGSLVVALELGLPIESIKKALATFEGTKRRFEYVGELESGAKVYDDYAHHPTEIRLTLEAFKQSFPKSKIVCIFQPHTYSRTKKLFDQFSSSFKAADSVILTNIFPSQREKEDKSISSNILARSVSKFNKDVVFLPKLEDVVEYLGKKNPDRNTVVITMGAGDVYKISQKLKFKN